MRASGIRRLGALVFHSQGCMAGLLLCMAASPVAAALTFRYTKQLFDMLGATFAIRPALELLIALAAVQAGQLVAQHFERYFNDVYSERSSVHIGRYVLNHVFHPSSITKVETPNYINDVNVLQMHQGYLSQGIAAAIGVLQQTWLIVTYAVLIFQVDRWIGLIVLAAAIPTTSYNVRFADQLKRHYAEQSQHQIETSNLLNILVRPFHVKEMLIFAARGFFLRKWTEASDKLLSVSIRFKRRELWQRLLLAMLNPCSLIAIQILLIRRIVSGTGTLGDYIAVTGAVAVASGAFLAAAMQLTNFRHIRNYFALLSKHKSEYGLGTGDANPDMQAGLTDIDSIRLEQVSFRYPHSAAAIRNVTLRAGKGEMIALVGANGSGKSTLAKVIVGLHDVAEGRLLYNDIAYDRYRNPDRLSRFSAVFQDYGKYPLTVFENIGLSEPTPESERRYAEVMEKFGYLLPTPLVGQERLRLGLDMLHSRQLSGGQWQRIAILRALCSRFSVLVLDEATSELDVMTEQRLMQDIRAYFPDKIIVVVTHNLALAGMADTLYVMEDGEIVERGKPHELLAFRGKYKDMWDSHQRQVELATSR